MSAKRCCWTCSYGVLQQPGGTLWCQVGPTPKQTRTDYMCGQYMAGTSYGPGVSGLDSAAEIVSITGEKRPVEPPRPVETLVEPPKAEESRPYSPASVLVEATRPEHRGDLEELRDLVDQWRQIRRAIDTKAAALAKRLKVPVEMLLKGALD